MKYKTNSLTKIFENYPSDPQVRIPEPMRALIRSGNFRFDIHTHIFNRDFIPDRYFGIRNPYMVNSEFLQYVEDVLSEIENIGIEDEFRSYAYFIDFSTKNSTERIADYLITNSPPNTIFVIISMDLNTAIASQGIRSYEEQLELTAQIRDKYPHIFLPFFEVNPTNPKFEKILRLGFKKLNFFGIKIYPSFGYMPSHPLLMKLFEIAEEKNIPVITHCGVDAAHSSQNFINLQYYDYDQLGNLKLRRTKRMFLFKNHFVKFFNRPQNWEIVLHTFPKLRLNFAHFGGQDDWNGIARTDRQWTYRIFDLMERYENVYADVSYILHLPTLPKLLKECITKNSIIADRTLFGTDFYMITAVGKYKEIRTRFVSEIGTELMNKISIYNPLRFLGLENLLK